MKMMKEKNKPMSEFDISSTISHEDKKVYLTLVENVN